MSFFDKLKKGLSKTKASLFGVFKNLRRVDEDLLEELEEMLICADVGVTTAEEIIDQLRDAIKENKLKEAEEVKQCLKDILAGLTLHSATHLDGIASRLLIHDNKRRGIIPQHRTYAIGLASECHIGHIFQPYLIAVIVERDYYLRKLLGGGYLRRKRHRIGIYGILGRRLCAKLSCGIDSALRTNS